MKVERGFNNILKTLDGLVQEVVLDFQEDGLKIQAIDKGMVSLMFIGVRKDFFKDYKDIGRVGVNLDALTKALGCIKDLEVNIELGVSKDKLLLSGKNKKLEVKLVDVEEDDGVPDLSTMEFPTKVSLPIELFKETLLDLEAVESECANFNFTNGFKIFSDTEGAKATCIVEVDEENKTGTIVRIPIGYMKYIARAVKYAEKINIEAGTDKPMKFNLNELDGKIIVNYYIAPRVSTE